MLSGFEAFVDIVSNLRNVASGVSRSMDMKMMILYWRLFRGTAFLLIGIKSFKRSLKRNSTFGALNHKPYAYLLMK